MADPEHLKLLQCGSREWNSWRRTHIENQTELKPDLSNADLASSILIGADLRGANLQGAKLLHANLAEADLKAAKLDGAELTLASFIEADLRLASLTNASLRQAQMMDSRLSAANLGNADLTRASLRGADFSGCRLHQACFENASLSETILANVNLSSVRGLTECVHSSPSIVDHRTIRSSSNVPIDFWRGCGLPDWQIEAARLSQPGLTQEEIADIGYEVIRMRADQPIQLFSVFISYSSEDEAFARRLYDDLKRHGVSSWLASEDMKIGDRIRKKIDEVIHLRDKLLLILSEHSVASEWVEDEVETAFEKERKTGESVLFPIKLDNTVDCIETGWAAKVRRKYHIGDFTNDDVNKESFERVLRDLRALS